jgi:uncharacterized SAM-binding protein YcdF (DUF218 family)
VFFLLSKLLSFMLSPVFWLALLLCWAWLTRRATRRYSLMGVSVLLAFISTSAPLADTALRAWEMPPRAFLSLPPHDAGILLTGLGDGRQKPLSRKILSRSANIRPTASRVAGILHLYRAGRIRRIIISGGSNDLIGSGLLTEARHLGHLLGAAGVPLARILVEERSRNTRENALFTKQLLANHPEIQSLVLVTSAYHQRRALGCFRKVGLRPTAFPTDFRTIADHRSIRYWVIPTLSALKQWHLLLHEMAGYLIYKVSGYC